MHSKPLNIALSNKGTSISNIFKVIEIELCQNRGHFEFHINIVFSLVNCNASNLLLVDFKSIWH